MVRTFEQWQELVSCGIGFRKGDEASRDEIARVCQLSSTLGDNCGVWHASHIVTGRRCNCAKCHPIKGAFKYHTVA